MSVVFQSGISVTTVSEAGSQEESRTEAKGVKPVVHHIGSLLLDTTSQHRAHLFDLNCKICTGKVVPSKKEEPPAEVKKVQLLFIPWRLFGK